MIKRLIVLLLGLVFMSFGIAFSIKAKLGTSPISSLPYVTNLMTGLSVGTTTIILHCILIALQVIILRKNYEPVQLLQLPVAFVFGYLVDLASFAIRGLECGNYITQMLFCVIGILLIGVGVRMSVAANLVVLAGEGFALAVCKTSGIQFPKMKIILDSSLVAISIVLSLLFLGGLYGVREGTVLAALCVGIVAKYVAGPIDKITKLNQKG